MSISIACVSCGKVYKLDDRFAGKRVKCNRCGSTFSVPAEAPSPEEAVAQAQPVPPSAVSAVASPPAESAHADPQPTAQAPSGTAADMGGPEQDASSDFSSSASGDATGEATAGGAEDWGSTGAADAPAPAAAATENQESEEWNAPATPVPPMAEPAPASPRAPERVVRDRPARALATDRPAPVPAPYPASKPSAPPARRSLAGLLAGLLYIVGLGVEGLGWYQMAAFELHSRGAGFSNDQLLRIELRGGIDVIAGLLILIFAALIHLRAAPKQAQAVSE